MGFKTEQELDERYVMHTFARKPVMLVEGAGMEVRDSAGKTYLDFIAGIGVNCLGHCHPAVVQALQQQAETLIHVSNYYYIEKRGEVAKLLSDMLNVGVDSADQLPWRSFFCNSGAEANECAIKLARLWAKKEGNGGHIIISLDSSFHGRTLTTLAATAQPAKQEAFQPLPGGFLHVPINDIDALKGAFAAHPGEIAAVIVEPVQGESGIHPCSADYLAGVVDVVHENGALLITDEVQSGIYRCGQPFAYQTVGIVPDIVTMAKGIAAGFPMGACAAREDVAGAFEPGDHGSTFGGSNLAIAAAYATLTTLQQGNFTHDVEDLGAYFRTALQQVEGVVEVRGKGLMVGCDLAEGTAAPRVVEAGLEAGFLLNYTGPSTLRFLPPLICTRTEIDTLVAALPTLIEKARD